MADESADNEVGGKNPSPRPRILVATIIGSLFLVEAVIMNFFHEFAETAHGMMDAAILTAVLLPLVYFFIYRPLSRSVKELKALSGTLERQVRERTAELGASEALYRTVVTSSVDAIVRLNRDGVILMANPAAHRMFGYGDAGLANGHISLLLPGGEYERVLADGLAEPPDGGHGAAHVVEAVAVTGSGATLTVECTVSESRVYGERSLVIIMRDISERKKAEHLLRESKARYRQLSEASFEGIVLAIGGKILDANDAFARMFGYTQDEIAGKTALDLSPPESHAIIMDHITRKSEEVYDALGLRKDGTRFPIEMRGRATLYQGQIARVTAVRDITGRKQAEELLRASRRRFMQFFTMLPVALGVVDKDGIICEINDRFTGTFGYTVKDIPTIKEWWERAYPDEAYRRQVQETWGNAVAKAVKEGADIEPMEYKVTCKNGAERFVMIGGIMLDGDVLATFVDVTERKRAEKALFESESRYRLMSEASFEGIVINIEGKVVDCNDAFARMFGYTPEEIIGKVPFDLAPPESHAIIMDHIRRESEEMYDVVARKKDGTLFNIEMRGRSIMHHGVKARITAMRDITGRVKAERVIRESEERLRVTFDSSGIGMVFADLHGRFERVNAALCRMLGHGAQDLIGKSCQEVTHPDDRHIGAGWLRKVASGQSDKQQIEERFIRKNGGVIWCSVAASVIKDAHGIPLHIFSTVIDITERKRAEDKLRHSEEDLRKAQEIAHVGNWNWDIVNDELRWSDEIYRIFGVVPSEFGATYEAFLSYVHPDDRAYVQQSVNDAIAKRSAYDINHRIVAADGGVRMVHEVGEVAYGETGAAVSMVGVVQDITELKKAEQALAESENKYRALVEETSDWVWAVDEKGVFTYSSPQVRDITGYGAEEVSGKSPFAFMAPEEGRRAAEFFHATAATQQSFRSFEHSTIHRDGRSVFIETSGVPCFDAEGRFAGYRGINRDITQRKAAEEVLRKSSQLLDAIIENIPNMIFLKRASDLRFELFNRAGEALVGHGRRELLGRNDYDFFPKDQADFFTAKDRETLERSDITDILEEPIKTSSGTRILHTKKLTLRNERGEPEYLLGISEDITERKAAEDELHRAKEAAEEATRLKDKFISLVSHDLKTPLASMIGFLRLVRHDHGEPLSDGAKLILDRAMESGDAMVHLIEDLLTISRFKTGQLKLNRQFFDAEYLGAMVVANLAHLAQVKGIEMESTIPANYRIYGDKTLLTEAVQNLVSNAIKFCRSGDRITIAAGGEGNAPEICVRDTGPGIKPAFLADLFKFEKKTSTTGTAGETGTGFGLPLVKSIMDLHGGGLKVESEPGKGSVFSFTLPYVRPKILLVDDDRYSRYLQMQILRTLNADILEAENGEDALDMIADVRPSLVITDIKMPVMDGLELLKRIKGKPETRDIPVIVISGEYGMEVRDTVFKFGGDDFVTKSRIDTVDFFPRIRRFIG